MLKMPGLNRWQCFGSWHRWTDKVPIKRWLGNVSPWIVFNPCDGDGNDNDDDDKDGNDNDNDNNDGNDNDDCNNGNDDDDYDGIDNDDDDNDNDDDDNDDSIGDSDKRPFLNRLKSEASLSRTFNNWLDLVQYSSSKKFL